MNELDALHRQILSAPTSEDAARLLVQAACALCGWSGGLLTVAVRSGTLVVGHGLEPGVEEYFQDRASHVSLAERRHNRERIREQAIPGTSITIVSASQDFHVVPTTATQADAPVASTWRADDTLFVRMPGAKGEVVGVLSLDGPPDGRAPDPLALGALLDVQQVLVAMGPALHARILDDHLQERERSGREAQRLELLGRVACEVAHDLNNLLLVITASADLALLEGHGSDDLLQDVISAADSARQLSWRLLTLGAPHADTERPLDVCASVDENADLLRRIFPADGPELHVRHDPGAQWVYAAPSAMTQILLNLVVNARDAEPISKVEVWVDEVQEYGVDFVVIGVSDDGHGMTPDVQRRVFERAFTTKATGSGIGLSAVKRIVDRLEGRILVESEPGVGTTFRVQLPRAKVSV